MKKLSESIWSDIQDRSMGKTVRKEDKITTNEDLKKKIEELYKEQGEGETLDVSSLTKLIKCDDFSYIFKGYKKVKHIIGLEDWDLSTVTNMSCMFEGCKNFKSDLSKWDVSKVEDMYNMFSGCTNFNSDLSNWNVSSVKYMYHMFYNCKTFNSDLSKWDVSNVEDMEGMFYSCDSLKNKPSWYMSRGLNESIWSDIQDRSMGKTVRKEDEKTNIYEIIPLDMGVDVLWADRDLEWKDGRFFFSYNEAENITNRSEWRIPTKNEVNQLLKHTKEIKNTDEVYIIEGDFDKAPTMTFNKKGFKYIMDDKVYNKHQYCSWTSTKREDIKNTYYINSIKHYVSMESMYYGNKLCVRLVKDK